MNYEGEGTPILKLYKSANDKKGKVISVTDRPEACKAPFTEHFCDHGEKIKLVPVVDRERNVLYVTGMSGSGKTYFCNEYIKEYAKVYTKRNVYLFSSLNTDKTLDSN
jgi:Cdc6-like AAA superfamily ATPase